MEQTKTNKNNIDEDSIDYDILNRLVKRTYNSLLPPLDISIEEWAAEHIEIKTGPRQGPFDIEYTPYLRRIFEAFLDPEVREIALMFSAQVGKSLAIDIIMAYIICVSPRPMIYVLPDNTFIKRYNDTKLKDMLDHTKGLKSRMHKNRRFNYIAFDACSLQLATAQSDSALAGATAPIVLIDETDRMPFDLKNQGSAVQQAKTRASAFDNRVIITSSTPTYDGSSLIQVEYEAGSQEVWHLRCCHCDELFAPKMCHLKWSKTMVDGKEKHDTSTTQLCCPHCGAMHHTNDKPRLNARGEWIAQNKNAPRSRVSLHMNVLSSPWKHWDEVADDFISAVQAKTPEALKAFTNLSEGLPFKEDEDRPDWQIIKNRAEPYALFTAPAGVCFLTAGVDVQKTGRLALSVYGWGKGEQAWLLYHGEFFGDIDKPQVWEELDEVLDAPFVTSGGVELKVSAVAVDSSDGNTMLDVYDYVRNKRGRNYIAVKGSSDYSAQALGAGKKQEINAKGKYAKGSIELFQVGTHVIKSLLYSRLKNDKPGTAGYMHFSNALPVEFYEQLTSEVLVTRYVNGKPTMKWVKKRDRNESLDTFVYAYSSALLLNIRNITPERWDKLASKLEAKVITSTDTNKEVEVTEQTVLTPEQLEQIRRKKETRKRLQSSGTNYATNWKR